MIKEFVAALFDLDGVVFDTEPQYSVFWEKQGLIYHPEFFLTVDKRANFTTDL